MGSDEFKKPSFLTDKTWIPLGKVVGVIGLTIAATMWCVRIDNRLESIEKATTQTQNEVMTRYEFEAWVKMFKAANPTVPVPEPLKRN